jgi:hypothetical protein
MVNYSFAEDRNKGYEAVPNKMKCASEHERVAQIN